MSFYLEAKLSVWGKDYDCHCVEQPNRAKGTRYKAYGTFEGRTLEAQASSPSDALSDLKRKAEITLG